MNLSPSRIEGNSSSDECTINNNSEIITRVTALEELINNQNSLLSNLNAECKLLLEKNIKLENKLDNALSGVANIQCTLKDEATACSKSPESAPVKTVGDGFLTTEYRSTSRRRPKSDVFSEPYFPNWSKCCSPVDGMNNNGDFSNEIIITNICEGSDKQRAYVAYAVLSTVFPPVERIACYTAKFLLMNY